jgi:CheY-like chemotaxis protein
MPRLLLIDDDPALCRALRLSLGQAGYTVIEAENGRQGLNAVAAQPPDLVITDIVMAETDGVEVICAIRKSFRDIPIIAISGGGRNAADYYLRLAKALGAAEVLMKPIDIEVLLAAVARRLGPAAAQGTPLPRE